MIRSRRRLLVSALAVGSVGPSLAPRRAIACDKPHLTFRWASGPMVGPGVTSPPEAALRNAPFLTDPDVVSIAVASRYGLSFLEFELAPEPGAIMARETSKHIGEQLLVALDDELVLAPIVRDVIVGARFDIDTRLPGPKLEALLKQLRGTRDCGS